MKSFEGNKVPESILNCDISGHIVVRSAIRSFDTEIRTTELKHNKMLANITQIVRLFQENQVPQLETFSDF